jgi:D-alanyl-D-alanine carboxypeptidase
MMTLYMAFDALKAGQLKLDQQLAVSSEVAAQRPSSIGLRKGERISVQDAIAAVVTKSANDAAVALAEAMAGSEAKFAKAMTDRARQLGMEGTDFRNASGLPNWRQRTTARDMAVLAMALLQHHADHYRYFALPEFTWKQRSFANHNQLLDGYDGADGIKTGYIRASGFNLVASAERNGRRLVGVLFGAKSPVDRDQRMIELLDYGFAGADERAQLASTMLPPPPKSILPLTLPPLISTAKAAAVGGNTDEGGWAIQVGSFVQRDKAERRIDAVGAIAPSLLTERESQVVHETERGRPVYRSRLLGFHENEARKACRELQRRKLPCAVLAPDDDS